MNILEAYCLTKMRRIFFGNLVRQISLSQVLMLRVVTTRSDARLHSL